MDNIILKSDLDFSDDYGIVVNFSKRIKLSEKSHGNVCDKISSLRSVRERSTTKLEEKSTGHVISFPRIYLEQSNLSMPKEVTTEEKASFTEPQVELPSQEEKSAEVNTVNISNNGTVLENVDLEDCSIYSEQSVTVISSRVIRLTDTMYSRVIAHTSLVQPKVFSSVDEMPTVTEVSNGNNLSIAEDVSINTGSLDSSIVNDSVQQAFDNTLETKEDKYDNGVKKASYSKAKVSKYKRDEKLPTNMLSDNGLFGNVSEQQAVSTFVSHQEVRNVEREIPIVVPKRDTKFLFNDFSVSLDASKSADEAKDIEIDLRDLKNIQVSSDLDEDFEELLAKVEKCQQEVQASQTKKMDAEKEFESSVQALKTAAQRYDVSSEALDEVKAKAYAYLNKIESNIEDNIRKEQELRTMTEEQKEKARKIEEAANRNEAHIEQFNTVLAVVPNDDVYNNMDAKTYSRSHSRAA